MSVYRTCRRYFATALPCRSASSINSVTRSIQEEKEDVNSMDYLLKVVRQRSNPAYHRIVPLRNPIPWSEALLNSAPRQDQAPLPPAETHDESPTPRRMGDSYSELILPFGSSPELMEQYTSASGGIRIGKLMEHLDSLAGSISYKHMLGPTVETLGRIQERGFYIVTASVDRLDMINPPNPTRDLRISGQVIHTGRSSMEVAVKMETIGNDLPEETVLIGRFTMVCRDAYSHTARPVNPLITSTPEEHSLYSLGEHMKKRRQILALRSLSRVPPSSTEAEELHTFYLKYGRENQPNDGAERIWMGDTILETTMLMFPQERNVHQKIFGGYLMRLAYELGITNSALFTRGPVSFLSLDSISFTAPVPIGSILRLTSKILYTTSTPTYPTVVHVGVKANVVDVTTGTERTTNDFRFTWAEEKNKDGGARVLRKVVPKTYQEAMSWLEGKRALEIGSEIRGAKDFSVM